MSAEDLDKLASMVLEGEDLRILDRLTPREKETAFSILLSLRDSGEYRVVSDFWQLDYERRPPTPLEFLEKDEYLASVGKDLYPKWREVFLKVMDPSSGIHELILRGAIGTGKCVHPNTEILKYDGSVVEAKTLKTGDFLMGPDSKPRRVRSCSRGYGPLYKIVPKAGRGKPWICNDAHLLTLKYSNRNGSRPARKKVGGQEIPDHFAPRKKHYRGLGLVYGTPKNSIEAKERQHELEKADYIVDVPLNEYLQKAAHCPSVPIDLLWKLFRVPVEFSDNDRSSSYSVEEFYLLGTWLGDGDTHQFMWTTPEPELVAIIYNYFQCLSPIQKNLRIHKKNKLTRIGVGLADLPYTNLQNLILQSTNWKELGFQEPTSSLSYFHYPQLKKNIPHWALTAPREKRLALLAGLVDTDGHVQGKGCRGVDLIQKYQHLTEKIVWLARSLGLAAADASPEIKACQTGASDTYYRTHISGDIEIIPSRVARKQVHSKRPKTRFFGKWERNHHDPLVHGWSVEPIGEGEYFGFTLDGDGRFLLGDFTVTHNSFMGSVVMTYIITWLLHLRSPVGTLLGNPSETSSIFLALLSTDMGQLEKNMWLNTIRMLRLCPFVQAKAHIHPERYYPDMVIHLPKNIILSGGSLVVHVLGQNLFAAFLDEANFRRSAEPQEEAHRFYYQIRRRIEGRFMRPTGFGFVGLISSEAGESVFLNRHTEEIQARQREGKPSDAYVCQYAEWDIKPLDLSGETFRVDIGDNLRSPKILSEGEEPREGAKLINVPVEYRNDAEKELISFLADIAGTVPGRANKYFYNVESVLRNFRLPNPVLSEIAELALDTEFEASDYLYDSALLIKVAGRYRPKFHASAPRYLHIDLAKSEDVAGFAMVHVGDIAAGGSPLIHTDLVIGFRASAAKPIDYDKILRLIYWLRDSGFDIAGISYDSYQSQHSMNTLDKEGFKVALRSVDRMKDLGRGEAGMDAPRRARVQPEYYSFRSILAEDRILLPDSVTLRREMLELINLEETPAHEKNKCLVGNTQIELLNGTIQTVEELAKVNRDRWVYASDLEGSIVPALARNFRLTQYVTELYKVTLDNAKTILCTPDHKFLLKNGVYVEAQCLSCGDRLMPLYRHYQDGYERIYSGGEWHFTHRLVMQYYGFGPRDGEVSHHIDHNRQNNEPANLERLSRSEHPNRHRTLNRIARQPEIIRQRKATYRRIVAARKALKRMALECWENEGGSVQWQKSRIWKRRTKTAAQRRISAQKMRETNARLWKNKDYREMQSLKGRLQAARRVRHSLDLNHQVVSTQKMIVPPTPVYDFTVPGYENLALATGVFVHNSKDLIDALVGAVANLIESENPILVPEGDFDRFPVWGSMRAPSGKEGRPKPPVEEKQLISPDYTRMDNIWMDP